MRCTRRLQRPLPEKFDERACGFRFSLVPRIYPICTTATLLMFAYLVCCWLLLLLPSVAVGETAKPNVVILFADDLGYGDLGVYGHPTSSTPNLDKMASEGLLFTQFYSASPVCSPSRAALLTGRYQTRTGIYPGVFSPASIGGLPHNESTLAEMLNLNANYSTAIVGKWHLGVGMNNQYLPFNHGFEYYMGIPYSHDMCPCVTCFYPTEHCEDPCGGDSPPCPVFENDTIVQQPADFTTLTENYMNAATSFIKSKAAAKKPFFLYVAFQHTHKPQFSGKRFTNKTIRGHFGDSLAELDWGVGQVFQALRDAGVDQNTFVFFTSDNGPSLHKEVLGGNGGLLRCGKGTSWEGGQREPAIAWWPGKIAPGRTAELAATVDMLPTVLAMAGSDLPVNRTLDGFDMAPVLFEGKKSLRDFYIYYPSNPDPSVGIFAVRLREYKAHFFTQGSLCVNTYYDEVCRSNYTVRAHNPPLLFNLNLDPGEIYPINSGSSEYNTVMAQITKLKADFESKMVWGESEMKRGSNPAFEPCAKPGCTPFPQCCTTTGSRGHLKYKPHTSRAVE